MISIIIPTYNRPKLLKRLLKSIDAQTYRKFEVIVVDDFSTNQKENEKICREYKFTQYLLNKKNIWPQYWRNLWIEKSKYNILCFCDDDDTWEETKLEKQYLLLLEDKNISIVYTHANIVNEKWEIIWELTSEKKWNIQKDLLEKNFIPSSSIMCKKECFKKLWNFDTSFPSCQDWEMWYRISKEYTFWVVPEKLINYYVHSAPSIWKSKKSIIGYLLFIKKNWKDYLKYGKTKILLKYILYSCKNYINLWK